MQPLGMLGQLEDFAAISALALEDGRAVVQGMGQYVHAAIAPGHELAVDPDETVPVVHP